MRDPMTTCVEITDTSMKVIQTTLQQASKVLSYIDTKEIAQASDSELSRILSGLIASAKIKPGNLIGVVPRQFAILRHVSLPSHADEEIEKMINLQVVKQVPYLKEDVVLDYAVLNKEPSGYAKVLVIAVHKEVAGRYLKIFQDAGLPLNKLTLSSVGILHWHIFEEEKTRQKNIHPVAVINIDAANSEICLCHQHKLLFSRNIGFGARDLQAEHIPAFVGEIGLTITTYAKEGIGEEVSKIILVSTRNEAALLKEGLEAEYKSHVVVMHPLDNVAQKKDLRLPPLERAGASAAVGLGLVLSHAKKFINLMPVEVSDTREIKQRKRELLKVLSLLALCVCLGLSIFGVRTYKHSAYLRYLQKKIDETKLSVEAVNEKIRRLKFIKERLNPGTTALDIIHELYNLTPSEVYFSVLYLDENGALTLQGISETSGGVNIFQKNLAGSAFFKDVTLQYATKRKVFKGELTDFKITCLIAPKEEK